MTDTVYCGACGSQIAATAKFCEACGASQEPFQETEPETQAMAPATQAAPPPPPPPPQQQDRLTGARENAERVAPGADELIGQLGSQLRTPGVAMAGMGALIGLAASCAVGLVLALLAPSASFLSFAGGGLLTEVLAQATSFSQANLNYAAVDATERTVPVLFVLIPILGVAAGVAMAASGTAGMPVRDRFLWAAAAGIPFAVAMLVISLGAGKVQNDLLGVEVEFSNGSVFLLSLLWGALGGVVGMLYSLRQEGVSASQLLPERPARLAGIAWAALRPLGLALVIAGAIGTAAWIVQVARSDEYRDFPPRSAVVAIGEQVAYAGDHAVDVLVLGAGGSERLSGNYAAVPIGSGGYDDLVEEFDGVEPPSYNLFDFSGTMTAALFIPMLIVFIAIPALLALYGGFAVARRVGERRPDRAALWGALVGPLWALAMALLATLARKDIFSETVGDSVFVTFLVGGAVLGALGGLLAAQGEAASADTPAPPQTAAPPAPPSA